MKPFTLSINEISPYVRLVGEFAVGPGSVENDRVLYDHLLLYVVSGAGTVIVGGETLDAEEGDVFLIKSSVVYAAKSDAKNPFLRQFVQFDFVYLGDEENLPINIVFPERPQPERFHPTPLFREGLRLPLRSAMKDHPEVRLLFSKIFEEMYHKRSGFQLAVKACLTGILLHIHRKALEADGIAEAEGTSGELPESVIRGKQFIEQNLAKKLSLKEIAGQAHVSPIYFERIFKRFMGYTPIEYMRVLKIQWAKERIRDTRETMTTIADRTGFESVHYFSRVFKKIEGIAPTQYRKIVHSEASNAPFLSNETKIRGYPTGKIFFA